MVRPVQLQQTEEHGSLRTTGPSSLRVERHHRARGSVPRGKRLAVVHGGTHACD